MHETPPGYFGRLARWVLGHRRATWLAALVLTALGAAGMARLHVSSDLLALMPQDDPSTRALVELDRREGGVTFLTVSLDGEDKEKRDAVADDLTRRLSEIEGVDYAMWRLDGDLAWRLGLLQIPMDDLALVRDRVRAALSLGAASANPFISARIFDLGPLTGRLAEAQKELQLAGAGNKVRIIVRPRGSSHDIPFTVGLMAEVRSVLDATEARMADDGVHVAWVGGAYRHTDEDYQGVKKDIAWTIGAAFVLVLAIVAAAFRAPRALVVVFLPLVMSNIWTMGLVGFVFGQVNSFTSFATAILVGLGIDFGIHTYARYRELRHAGLGLEDAVVRAWDFVGGPCLAAALTSAGGFLALLLGQFAGFRQLGGILAVGLLLTLVATLVLCPLLIAALEPRLGRAPPARHVRRRRRISGYRMAPVTLAVLASLTVVAGLLIRRIEFETDLSEMRRAGMAYEELTEDERALARDSYAPVVLGYATEEAMADAHARLAERIESGRFTEVARAVSLRTVLPGDQAERVALLGDIAALASDPGVVYLPGAVQIHLAKIRDLVPRVLTPDDLPPAVRHALGAKSGDHRLLLFPAGNMWDMREAAALANAVERELALLDGIPRPDVAGEYLTLGVLFRLMTEDATAIIGAAFALVAVFVALDLRSLRLAAGALAALVAGVCWWGALLVLARVKVSIMNFVGIPFVFGIGIDVMIHLMHRLREEGPGRIRKAMSTTGWAVALSTLTTVVAFAALSFASSQGVRSLGLLVLLGETAVTAAGFVLVPLGFATAWRLQGRHPKEDSLSVPPAETTDETSGAGRA